jgi:hypothetical protein
MVRWTSVKIRSLGYKPGYTCLWRGRDHFARGLNRARFGLRACSGPGRDPEHAPVIP